MGKRDKKLDMLYKADEHIQKAVIALRKYMDLADSESPEIYEVESLIGKLDALITEDYYNGIYHPNLSHAIDILRFG